MGGRWDATNVTNAPVAVITPIGIDHVDYLEPISPGSPGRRRGHLTQAPTVRRIRSRRSWNCCLAESVRAGVRFAVLRHDRSRSAVRYCNCRAPAGCLLRHHLPR